MPGAVPATSFTIKGVNTTNSGHQKFVVLAQTVDAWHDLGITSRYYDTGLLVTALANPTSIFSGLRRRGRATEGLCYCCKPTTRHGDLEVPANMVYAAYIMFGVYDFDLGVVVDGDWWPEDAAMSGHPHGWQDDYEVRTWPTT